MINIWFVYLISLLPFSIIKDVNNKEVFSILFIAIQIIHFSIFVNNSELDKNYKLTFIFAYFLRIGFLLFDIYGRNIMVLPNSGGDSEGFYYSAIKISKDLSLISSDIYGGIYSKFLGMILFISGDNRIIAQYSSVIFGITSMIIIEGILRELKIDNNTNKLILNIYAIFPQNIIFSSILLRENFIIFFITLSLFYFILWSLDKKSAIYMYILLIPSVIAHSGIITIYLGYFVAHLFYNRRKKEWEFSKKTIIIFLSILLIIITFSGQILEIINRKLYFEDANDLVDRANSRRGGSAYLTNLETNNLFKLILFIPLKILYFLFVPFPWQWRGTMDIISFLLDSLLYLYLYYGIYKNRSKVCTDCIGISIVISILAFLIVFGQGISNVGTAIRHRHKILTLVLVLFAKLNSNEGLMEDKYGI